jgi:hypothetical protein
MAVTAVTLSMLRTLALVATILMVATGCDKKTRDDLTEGYVAFIDKVSGVAEKGKPLPVALTNLEGEPPVLFYVFGRRGEPRMVPLGVVRQGQLRRVVLNGRGWREFTRAYTSTGDTLQLFQDGRRVGTATVSRPMWDSADSAVYSLPNCKMPLPLSLVTLRGDVGGGVSGSKVTVEAFASNRPLGRSPEPVTLSPAQVERTGKDIGLLVAAKLGMSPESIDSLFASTIAVPTGHPERPTLIINMLDPALSDTAKKEGLRQVFIIADAGPFGYGPTFWHFRRGPRESVQFRRYVDHLDVDGDGYDEIILEAWYPGRQGAFFVVLGQRPAVGGWEERYRTDADWCQDKLFPPEEAP